jgi:hypothetical protein
VQVRPVAAAVSVAPAMLGPRRLATVAAVTDHAVYLITENPDSPAICVITPSAVRVPCALVLGAGAPVPGVRVGDVGLAGGGELVLGGVAYQPARWWRPSRPRISTPPPAVFPPPLHADTWAAVAGLAYALANGAPLAQPVTALLGRGPGLTPLGDDVLAGALVALVAAGSPTAPRLAAAVLNEAFRRTTFVSAALLWHAARGECVPELAAALAGTPDAAEALLRIGHSSGVGLAHGIRVATAALGGVPA